MALCPVSLFLGVYETGKIKNLRFSAKCTSPWVAAGVDKETANFTLQRNDSQYRYAINKHFGKKPCELRAFCLPPPKSPPCVRQWDFGLVKRRLQHVCQFFQVDVRRTWLPDLCFRGTHLGNRSSFIHNCTVHGTIHSGDETSTLWVSKCDQRQTPIAFRCDGRKAWRSKYVRLQTGSEWTTLRAFYCLHHQAKYKVVFLQFVVWQQSATPRSSLTFGWTRLFGLQCPFWDGEGCATLVCFSFSNFSTSILYQKKQNNATLPNFVTHAASCNERKCLPASTACLREFYWQVLCWTNGYFLFPGLDSDGRQLHFLCLGGVHTGVLPSDWDVVLLLDGRGATGAGPTGEA